MARANLKSMLILCIGLLTVVILTIFLRTNDAPIILEPFRCNVKEENTSKADDSDCRNHIFPSRKQTIGYLNNSTFMRSSIDGGYVIRYFDSNKNEEIDGHYREMALSVKDHLEPSITTDHGPWWLRDVVIPIEIGNEIINKKAQALCTHDKTWEPPHDMYADDVEDVYIYCGIVLDLSGKILYGKSYISGTYWKKIASNDAYNLASIIKNYSPDFATQVNEKPAGYAVILSPRALAELIAIKNKEIFDKMHNFTNSDPLR